jgi:large subunit ribosomal protein L22
MEIKATQTFTRISPQKINYLAGVVKSLPVDEALVKLRFTNHKAAALIAKLIKQALANANSKKLSTQGLHFKTIEVLKGPTLKRWRATARGRGVKINELLMSG